MPAEDECSNERTEEDADDKIPVEVHGQQHNDVGDGKLSHVQERANELLEEVGREGLRLEKWRGRLS